MLLRALTPLPAPVEDPHRDPLIAGVHINDSKGHYSQTRPSIAWDHDGGTLTLATVAATAGTGSLVAGGAFLHRKFERLLDR